MANTLTTNYSLKKPAFSDENWHTPLNENFDVIDALLSALGISSTFKGVWQNATAYTAGDYVVDSTTHDIYVCLVGHTSAASPTTFASDRTTNPTYWALDDPSKQVDIDTITASKTLTQSDAGKLIVINSASAVTITLPQNSTEALVPGFAANIFSINTGTVTVAKEGSDTIQTPATLLQLSGQYSHASIVKTSFGSPNTWMLAGDVV